MSLEDPLGVVLAGLGREALFVAEQAVSRSDLRIHGLFEPDAERQWLLPLAGGRRLTWDNTLALAGRGVLLLDPTLDGADRLFQCWVEARGRVLIAGTSGLTSARLAAWRELLSGTASTPPDSRVGIVETVPVSPDTRRAEELVLSGQLGRLVTATWTSHALTSLEPPTQPRVGDVASWLTERLWPLTETLRRWGYRLAGGRSLSLVEGRPRAAVVISCWSSADVTAPAMRLMVDLDDSARIAKRPGWSLEGDLGSYADGMLYQTTSAGEIVDLPQALPPRTGAEALEASLAAIRADAPLPLPLSAARESLAWAEELAR